MHPRIPHRSEVPPRRHRWYAAVAAAVVATLVVAGWAGGLLDDDRDAAAPPPSPLSCPGTYVGEAPWVPTEPGADTDRLVPPEPPVSALVCAYEGMNTDQVQSGWALSGQRSLTGGLDALAEELTWLPRRLPGQEIPCTQMGGPQVKYLVGLEYEDRTIWITTVSEPNNCGGVSNGDFDSFGTVDPDVTSAFNTGQWPDPKSTSCDSRPGRLGQEATMLPPDPAFLVICERERQVVIGSDYSALVAALNGLTTKMSTRSCSPSPPESARTYRLVFGYPEGPSVAIYVNEGCYPEIDNGSLQSQRADTILPLIEDLTAAN